MQFHVDKYVREDKRFLYYCRPTIKLQVAYNSLALCQEQSEKSPTACSNKQQNFNCFEHLNTKYIKAIRDAKRTDGKRVMGMENR